VLFPLLRIKPDISGFFIWVIEKIFYLYLNKCILMKKLVDLFTVFLLSFGNGFSQVEVEVHPPFNIKTVSFMQNGQNIVPIFKRGESVTIRSNELYHTATN